jgi:hypothetical protein
MSNRPILAVALPVILGLALFAAPAEAKPKRPNPGGCSMAQLQKAATETPAGRACAQAQDQSVINNTTFIMFVCTSEGVYCCPSNASSAADCSKISAAKVNPGILDNIAPGVTLQSN